MTASPYVRCLPSLVLTQGAGASEAFDAGQQYVVRLAVPLLQVQGLVVDADPVSTWMACDPGGEVLLSLRLIRAAAPPGPPHPWCLCQTCRASAGSSHASSSLACSDSFSLACDAFRVRCEHHVGHAASAPS